MHARMYGRLFKNKKYDHALINTTITLRVYSVMKWLIGNLKT